MRSRSEFRGLWQQVVIAAVAGVICFVNLGAAGLWDLDEALYTSIAREMSHRGDWIVPTFNSGVFLEKPPLMFWLMMGSFKFLGISEFSARLPAAIFAIGTALATYHLARRLFSAEVGFWAGLITTSNIIFTISARAATVDSALLFVTTLIMALFARGARIGEAGVVPPAGRSSLDAGRIVDSSPLAYLPASWSVYALIGILLGVAMLAKGPIGFLLPAASLGLFLLVMNRPAAAPATPTLRASEGSIGDSRFRLVLAAAASGIRRALRQLVALPAEMVRVTWAMRPLTVLAFAALAALPWYLAITWKTHGEWLEQFVAKYNLRPFLSPFLGHRGPFYYHFVVVLVGLFPWSVFLGPTIASAWRAMRARGKDFASYVFVVSWVGVFFGFWSICSTKLPHYVLPAYPALGILTACFLHAWIERTGATARYIMPIATSIFLGVGVALMAVLPWVTARYAPGEQIIALLGLVPFLGGSLCWYLLATGRRRTYLGVFAAASVLFIALLFGWAAVHIDRHQHSRPLMEAVRSDSPAEPQIAGYKYCDASTVYYARGAVAGCDDAARLRQFLAGSPHPYVITTGDEMTNLERQMPGQWRIVARRPRFLAKGEIVVLAPRAAANASLSQRGDGRERF
jgi:4-amino-4-deoxy-L-arabinose transferase-like glycosyltransferase